METSLGTSFCEDVLLLSLSLSAGAAVMVVVAISFLPRTGSEVSILEGVGGSDTLSACSFRALVTRSSRRE